MNNPLKITGFVSIAACVLGASLFSLDAQDANQAIQEIEAEQQQKLAGNTSTPVSQQSTKQLLPGIKKEDQSFQFDEEMKQRLQTISEAYEDKIRFPSFSQPIKAGELETKYMPDVAIANEQPARLTDPNSPTLSIKTSKMRYFSGDKITATATIKGIGESETSSVSAQLIANGQVLAYATVTPLPHTPHDFSLVFSGLESNVLGDTRELTIATEFQFLGNRYQRGTSIEYINTIAQVDGIAPATVEGSFLSIPVYISTQKPGYHRIKANLYDAKSNTPLVHLRAESLIDDNIGELTLKAHIAALKEAGSEGPYKLRDIALERLPSEPDYITEFGKAEQTDFDIEQFSFAEYHDQPYINEKAQRIAKELRRMGS